ncbi:MAG: hypothetical protein LBV20_04595 [Treponema sp.]|nr:hypothetical protein [Treponema sp.]
MTKPVKILLHILESIILLSLIFFIAGIALFMYFNKAPDSLPSINENMQNMSLENGNLLLEVKSG